MLRLGEAIELALVTYSETGHYLASVTIFFIFIFAVALLAAGVRDVGTKVALSWHVVLELLLIPLSLYLAFLSATASNSRLLSSLSIQRRFAIFAGIFLVLQGLLAKIGSDILKWIMGINNRRRSC